MSLGTELFDKRHTKLGQTGDDLGRMHFKLPRQFVGRAGLFERFQRHLGLEGSAVRFSMSFHTLHLLYQLVCYHTI